MRYLPVCAFSASMFIWYSVWWSDEAFTRQRHKSIDRDIKREAWRRRELGLDAKE